MNKYQLLKLSILAIASSLLLMSCTQEVPFVPEYISPEENMVLVEGGTFEMGDWLIPYFLDMEVCEGENMKDITQYNDWKLDFTFDARAIHEVTVNSFYISQHEVTLDEYDRYCHEMVGHLVHDGFEGDADYPPYSWGRGQRPAIFVTWMDAVAYCNWLSVKEGLQECYTVVGFVVECDFDRNGYRLPTEAEWEYAARGGQYMIQINDGHGYLYSGCADYFIAAQDSVYNEELGGYYHTDYYTSLAEAEELNLFEPLKDYAWFHLNSGWIDKDAPKNDNGETHPVGTKLPNELGIYDMTGNVWEWCWDFYSPEYYQYCQAHPDECDNPKGPLVPDDKGGTTCHVLRGGTWFNYPVFERTTFRFFSKKHVYLNYVNPSYQYCNYRIGFRIVRNAEDVE